MPMVVHRKQRLHFRFEGERGAFLVLHHGLLGSSQDWFDLGYVDALADQFRLIIPDARGHGRSDRPVDPADYGARDFADDLIAVMDALDIRNSHFLGVSLGALVGFDLLRRYPDRLRVTLLGGEVPFVTPDARQAWAALAALAQREPWAQIAEALRRGAPPGPAAPPEHVEAAPRSEAPEALPPEGAETPAAAAAEPDGNGDQAAGGDAPLPAVTDAAAASASWPVLSTTPDPVSHAAGDHVAGGEDAVAAEDAAATPADEAEPREQAAPAGHDGPAVDAESGSAEAAAPGDAVAPAAESPASVPREQAAAAAGPATALATPHDEDPRAAGMALLDAMAGWPVFPDERTAVESPLVFFDGAEDPAHARLDAAVGRVARARLITYPDTTTVDLVQAREPVLELLFRYIRTGRRGDEPRPEQGSPAGQGSQQEGNGRSRNRNRSRGRRGRDGGGNRGGEAGATGPQGSRQRQRDEGVGGSSGSGSSGSGGRNGEAGAARSQGNGNGDSRHDGAGNEGGGNEGGGNEGSGGGGPPQGQD